MLLATDVVDSRAVFVLARVALIVLIIEEADSVELPVIGLREVGVEEDAPADDSSQDAP